MTDNETSMRFLGGRQLAAVSNEDIEVVYWLQRLSICFCSG